MDGQDGSAEQQGLLKEVVLVGVSPDASKTRGCLQWFHGSWLAARDQEGIDRVLRSRQAGVCCVSCSALQFSGAGLCVCSDALGRGEARKPLMHTHVKVAVAAETGWS